MNTIHKPKGNKIESMSYKCDACPAEFKTQRGLENHKHRWFCSECGKKLTTKNGYDRHVARHSESVSKKTEKDRLLEIEKREREDQFRKKVELLKEKGLFNPIYKQGDKVILSTYRVTKPTHEKRLNRIVRVIYEEERYYYAQEFTARGHIEPEMRNSYQVERCIRENEQYSVEYMTECNRWFNKGSVFSDIKTAIADARKNADEYKKACEQVFMCR